MKRRQRRQDTDPNISGQAEKLAHMTPLRAYS
jgi:hypothetical protein